MRIINPEELWNGAHAHLEVNDISECPPDWAIVPDDMVTENYPYGKIDTGIREDGYLEVTNWIPNPIPAEEVPTPAELREAAYNNDNCISWEGEMVTVTEAAQLWQYYASEGHDYATQLQTLIAEAKANIRIQYPD